MKAANGIRFLPDQDEGDLNGLHYHHRLSAKGWIGASVQGTTVVDGMMSEAHRKLS